MHKRTNTLGGLLFLGALVVAHGASADATGPAASDVPQVSPALRSIDVSGVSVGMPMDAAIAALKQKNPKLVFQTKGPDKVSGSAHEMVQLDGNRSAQRFERIDLEAVPTPPYALFSIVRVLSGGVDPVEFRDRLRAKFGKETVADVGEWAWNDHGALLSPSCENVKEPFKLLTDVHVEECRVSLHLHLQTSNGEAVVQLVSIPLGTAATRLKRDASRARSEEQRKARDDAAKANHGDRPGL